MPCDLSGDVRDASGLECSDTPECADVGQGVVVRVESKSPRAVFVNAGPKIRQYRRLKIRQMDEGTSLRSSRPPDARGADARERIPAPVARAASARARRAAACGSRHRPSSRRSSQTVPTNTAKYANKCRSELCRNCVGSPRNRWPIPTFTGSHREVLGGGKSLNRLREEVFRYYWVQLAGFVFQACSFNHSDISPSLKSTTCERCGNQIISRRDGNSSRPANRLDSVI